MSNFKEEVDNYLYDIYFKDGQHVWGELSWKTIAEYIREKYGIKDYIDSEYVRGRFRALRKKYIDSKNEALEVIEPLRVHESPVVNELSSFTYKYEYKENRDKGTAELTSNVEQKLSDEQIYEKYNVDKNNYRISQVWYKDKSSGGYVMSVLFTSVKNKQESIDYKADFQKFIDKYNLNVFKKDYPKFTPIIEETKKSVLLNLSDLHVGKLAWDKEVGADYNVDIAKQVFMQSLQSLVNQSVRCFQVEEFVLNIGGDFLHTNGSLNQTANGTNMNDVDTRYQKIYIKGLEILTEAVDYLSSFGAKVKVFIVQGNHDKATSFYLGESLKAFYRNDKNVVIENDPQIRKYHKYGVTSYMLTHGDCKDDGLPLTFATEKPDYFANSQYRYIYLGHLHKTSKKVYLTENEVSGVVLRRLNSLSVMDAWHNENNYYGAKRMANAIVFDEKDGNVAEFFHIVKKSN